MNRRQFLIGGAAAAATAYPLGAPSYAGADTKDNLFDILKKHTFTDINGRSVNISALRTSLRNQFTTLSFGFMGCSDFCPLALNPNLEALGTLAGDRLTRIIINVAPENEGISPLRESYPEYLRGAGLERNTIVLFPANNAEAVQLQAEFGMIANLKNPSGHSAKIMLYRPDGAFADDKLATRPQEEFKQDWSGLLSSPTKGR